MSVIYNVFQKIEAEGTFPNLFYEVSIIALIPQSDKDKKRKPQMTAPCYTGSKVLNKILANQIQQVYR